MLDVLIRGGTVVTPATTERFDVGVKDGRIVAFAEENSVDLRAARTVDARGNTSSRAALTRTSTSTWR